MPSALSPGCSSCSTGSLSSSSHLYWASSSSTSPPAKGSSQPCSPACCPSLRLIHMELAQDQTPALIAHLSPCKESSAPVVPPTSCSQANPERLKPQSLQQGRPTWPFSTIHSGAPSQMLLQHSRTPSRSMNMTRQQVDITHRYVLLPPNR